MKQLHIVYVCDEIGEIEGVYDIENDMFLDIWSCNDANWRSEYFDGFLRQLGIQFLPVKSKKKRIELEKKLVETAKDMWGL